MPDAVMNSQVARALDAGAVVITANQRLARHLQHQYVDVQRARGRAAWPTPEILPLSTWLDRAWSECVDRGGALPLLLRPHHAQLAWEAIITDSRHGGALLDVPATAAQAQEAWTLSRQYRLSIPPTATVGEDARAYAAWARRFEQRCRDAGWLDAAALSDRIAQLAAEDGFSVPARIALVGFHEFTPQQRVLFDALRASGTRVDAIAIEPHAGRVQRVAPGDTDAEIRAAAQWVRAHLEAGSDDIGVIVRDLAGLRDRVERIFVDVLAPGADARGLVNVSLGRPLSGYPIVHAALLLLELGSGRIAIDRLGVLLRSPFLGEAEREAVARAHLDARLRENGQLELSLDDLRAALRTTAGRACPALDARLAHAAAFGGRRRPSEWAEAFAAWLSLLGWPGERTLDSDEYQTALAWRELLADYRSLDPVVSRQSAGEAIAILRRMASRSVFQPQQDAAPVQVLGVLEAAGLRFTQAWLLGFADDAWPPSPRPHPFLPLALQREHDVPHATAARELAFCRVVTADLRGCAPDVVVSAPLLDGERHLRASPLFADIPLIGLADVVQPRVPDYAAQMREGVLLESLTDDHGPSFDAEMAAGGASLFRNQAACPFRAFAQTRLHAVGLASVQPGLDPAERGTLLHQVLFELWGRLGDQAHLCALSADGLTELVRDAVADVLTAARARAPARFPATFARLEQARLQALVGLWLERERARAPFSVVAREQARTVIVEGLRISTRADRIDRLDDGKHLIIDYKTGSPREADWFGERPDEPQLPLYCVTADVPVDGIAFAQLSPRDLRWRGIARSDGIADGIAGFDGHRAVDAVPSWEAIIEQWRDTLSRLAREFLAGNARIDPKEGPATCRYCDLAPLCRIHEHNDSGLTERDDE